MKIDSHKPPESQGPKRGAQNIQKTQDVQTNTKPGQAAKPATADKVDISGRSKEIADARTALSKLPDVREAKVQEIKQRVDNGTYTIDPLKVAQKILKEI